LVDASFAFEFIVAQLMNIREFIEDLSWSIRWSKLGWECIQKSTLGVGIIVWVFKRN